MITPIQRLSGSTKPNKKGIITPNVYIISVSKKMTFFQIAIFIFIFLGSLYFGYALLGGHYPSLPPADHFNDPISDDAPLDLGKINVDVDCERNALTIHSDKKIGGNRSLFLIQSFKVIVDNVYALTPVYEPKYEMKVTFVDLHRQWDPVYGIRNNVKIIYLYSMKCVYEQNIVMV
jgi:hypothetical protein